MDNLSGRLQGRVALITGASRGIGAAVARLFAKEGAHIIAVARTEGALEELDDDIKGFTGESATLVPMDITDSEKVDQMGALIHQRFGRLDVLVGNAGILGTLSPLGHIDPKIWDQVIAVNVSANWRLLRSMDPLLRSSDAGRAIFVTSTVGAEARAYWGAYAVSKAALEMMTRTYAKEIDMTPIRVNMVNPGATRTQMRSQAMPGEDPNTLPKPEDRAEVFVDLALPSCTANGELFTA
ncbi:MAG: oxidoreductase [Magnetovibrio sp.]|nr:oxidoreductase [Magnetovibrio sp.]